MNNTIKAILIQEGEPTPNNPVEIKKLLVNEEAEKYINDLKKENQQLKHNRDKAINHLDLFISDINLSRYDTLKILMHTKKLLKGDSDE